MGRARQPQVSKTVRQRIEAGGERLWRSRDFLGMPAGAVAQALSRLAREGHIERVSKGVYYRPRETAFGKSRPNPADVRKLATGKAVFPAGVAAANLLGFTTQIPARGEVSTSGFALPRKLLGGDTVVHTRRPEAWAQLAELDAALLDFLRRGGATSDLPPADTIARTLALLGEKGRFERLLKAASSEPPRVRALLGALGEELGKRPSTLEPVRQSLNPFSRFNFGVYGALPRARQWQAREQRT